jgi:hypothetical protein
MATRRSTRLFSVAKRALQVTIACTAAMNKSRMLVLAGLLFALVASGHAQQTGITGRVLDSSGAAIPGAQVTVREHDGASFQTKSNAAGEFQIPALRADDYTISVQSGGFAPYQQKISILVGQTLSVEAKLMPAGSSQTVTVNAQTATIDTSSSQVAGNVDPEAMKTIPLNGRNWLELATLVPGIRVNAITNFTPLGTTVSGKFQLQLDGQQVTQNTADPKYGQPQFSRDAIGQFQIITNRFDATSGRSSQIFVIAQSKSGTDTLHGSAFGYFRDSSLNVADPVAHKVLPFQDQQFGGSLGGPVSKGRTWYFGSYEGEHNPGTVISTPPGGFSQYTQANDLDVNEYLARVDRQINPDNHLMVRGNGYTWRNPYNLSSGTVNPSQLYASTRTSYGFAANWSSTHGSALVNEVKAGFNHFEWTNDPYVKTVTFVFPTTQIGGPANYPQDFTQSVQQYRDDVYWLRGKHSIKTGVEYLFNHHGGSYYQSARGQLACNADPTQSTLYPGSTFPSVFPNLLDPSTWKLNVLEDPSVCGKGTYTQAFGNFNMNVPRNTIGAWFQDDWKVNNRLTMNLGIRYDNDIGVWDTGLKLNNGLAIKHGGNNHNFAPRVGFALDLFGDGRTSIRGGAGMYFADVAANQIINQELFNGQTNVSASVQGTAASPINLSAPFGATTPQEILANPSAYVQSPQLNDPSVTTPWSFQASLGAQHQFGTNWQVSIDAVNTRVYHDWAIRDSNLFYDPATGFNKNPSVYGRPMPQFTLVADSITPHGTGSEYEGIQVGIQRRLENNWTTGVSYTLSEYRDSSKGPFYYPNNPFDLKAEWATSTDDQRNTLSATADYHWRWGLQGGALFHFGSGNAYGTTVGGTIPTGLGVATTNRTFASTPEHYNANYGSKTCAAVFASACTYTYNDPRHNYLDPRSNFYITSRDAFRGAPIEKLDLHLQKSFTFAERYKVSLIAESFNTLNHSNFGAYSTVVTSSNFGTPAAVSGNPPAYGSRAIQFAARLDF